jgi:uncharacterized protein YbjT (DUF2867 family)
MKIVVIGGTGLIGSKTVAHWAAMPVPLHQPARQRPFQVHNWGLER